MKKTALVHAKDDPIHVLVDEEDYQIGYAERADTKEVYVNVYTYYNQRLEKHYGVLNVDRMTAEYMRTEVLGSKCVYRLRIKKKSGKNKRKVK